MVTEIKRIVCGMVNCYLVTGKAGSVLVDTGEKGYEEKVLRECGNKNVRLLVLTHGVVLQIKREANLQIILAL